MTVPLGLKSGGTRPPCPPGGYATGYGSMLRCLCGHLSVRETDEPINKWPVPASCQLMHSRFLKPNVLIKIQCGHPQW